MSPEKKKLQSALMHFSRLPTVLFLFVVVSIVVSSSTSIYLTQNYFSNTGARVEQSSPPPRFKAVTASPQPIAEKPEGDVLGLSDSVYFTSNIGRNMNEGVIVLSSAMEPVVEIRSWNFKEEVNFSLYKINEEDLLNYLRYSSKESEGWYGSQLKKLYEFDTNQLELVSTFNQQIGGDSSQDHQSRPNLDLEQEGIWYLEGTHQDQKIKTVIVRSSLAGVANKSDNKITFWVQDSDKKLVADAKIKLLNTQDTVKTLGDVSTNDQGIVEVAASDALDIAIVSHNNSLTIVPINLNGFAHRNQNGSYYSFGPRIIDKKSFIFTDRFIYKPGDTLYYKAIFRTDDDASYSLPSGQVRAVLSGGQNGQNNLYEAQLLIDDLGTIDHEISLPDDLEVGYYSLTVYDGDTYLTGTSVQVAEFRKPDSEISLHLEEHTYYPGDTFKAQAKGSYFLGQPLSDQTVRYKVYQYKASLDGHYEGITFNTSVTDFGARSPIIAQGSLQLDKNGVADLEIDVKNTTGYRQMWAIVLEYVDATGTATNDARQILINPGDFVIEQNPSNRNNSHVISKNSNFSINILPTKAGVDTNGIEVSAQVYEIHSGDKRFPVGEAQRLISNNEGEVTMSYTPKKSDSHEIEFEARDKHDNVIRGDMHFYVRTEEVKNSIMGGEKIDIETDKDSYAPGETATITLLPSFESQDLFVYVGRSYSKTYQVLTNGSKQFSLTIPEDYQPNVRVAAGSFVGDYWVQGSQDVEVSTDDKKVELTFDFDQEIYGPAQTAIVDIAAKDALGNPVQTDVSVWVFDKALLELNRDNYGRIFDTFWGERYTFPLLHHSFEGLSSSGAEGGGGCFAADTSILMSDSSLKEISQVKTGDWIQTLKSSTSDELVSAQVTDTHLVEVDGYLIINQDLKITPEHKLLVNGKWQTAGQLKVGDELTTAEGLTERVSSIEWMRGKFSVYNLTVDTYHTFIANGIYVHNDKGDSRSIFKDTAYWNPHVATDAEGKARVTIQLPDNLTTWVIAGVSANQKTQVGSGEDEFIVTKELVVRPVMPSFLRQGDILHVSALLNNFTDQDLNLEIDASLNFSDFQVTGQPLLLAAKGLEALSWPVEITSQQSPATFHVRAQTTGQNEYIDEVFHEIPVYEYGFWQDSYLLGENQQTYDIPVSTGAVSDKTQTVLTLQANKYPEFKSDWQTILVTESIYFSNAPAILSMVAIGEQFGSELNLEYSSAQNQELAQNSIHTLVESFESDQSWKNFTGSEQKVEFLEALIFARKSGIVVDQNTLNTVIEYFAKWQPNKYEDQVMQQYAFSLTPELDLSRHYLEVNSSTNVERALMAIMANYRQGFVDQSAAIQQILDLKFENSYQLSWPADQTFRFGGIYKNSSRAVAALIELKADQEIVEKGLDFLYRNRDQQASYSLIRSIAEYLAYYTDSSQELAYTVSVDDQVMRSGTFKSSDEQVVEIPFEVGGITDRQLKITHQGESPVYSTVKTTEFITDRAAESESNHLEISRKYLSASKNEKPIEVGDLVVVELTVKNLGLGERNLEIIDYLPSGLVAIDESLDNGVFDNVGKNQFGQIKISGQTVELKISYTDQDVSTFRYKARVISQGTFDTPPAIVRHSFDPTLWARSNASQLVIDGKNSLELLAIQNSFPSGELPSPAKSSLPFSWKWIVAGILVLIPVAGYGIWIKKPRHFSKFTKDATPPDNAPPV